MNSAYDDEVEDYDRVKSRGQTGNCALLNRGDFCINHWFGKDRAEMYVGEDWAAEKLGIGFFFACQDIVPGFRQVSFLAL